jgi:hypothetical protein
VVGTYTIANNANNPATITYRYPKVNPQFTYTYVVNPVGTDPNTPIIDYCNVATFEVIRARLNSGSGCTPP